MSDVPISEPTARAAPNWAGVITVGVGTFALVTTEMLPVGLLPAIGGAMQVSDGTAGLMVMVPGLVAAVAAPLLTVAAGGLDRRLWLCLLMALLLAGNVMSALSPDFTILLVSRVLVGLSIGGFWAIAGTLAVRLVPPELAGRATAMIFGGIAVASVAGVPAGTLIGDFAGWRAAFVAAAVLSVAVLAGLALALPRLPARQSMGLAALPRALGNRGVRTGLIATFLLVIGHFAAYTFVSPVLQRVAGFDGALVGPLLLAYGVAGILGNFIAGPAAARAVRRTLLIIVAALAATLLSMPLLGSGPVGGAALLLAWGLAYGGVSVSLQTWVLTVAPHESEAASSLFAAIFNLSISLGALIGGRVVDSAGPAGVLWLGGVLALLTVLPVWADRHSVPAGR